MRRARPPARSIANLNTAVHDYRKALRRARAVLSLVAGALPKSERRAVRRALQEARRGVSPTRDHAVAPEVIHGARARRGFARCRERDHREREGRAAAEPPRSSSCSPRAPRAPPRRSRRSRPRCRANLEWDTIEQGVRDTYDAARRARRAAKRSKRQFHTWRRRCKELDVPARRDREPRRPATSPSSRTRSRASPTPRARRSTSSWCATSCGRTARASRPRRSTSSSTRSTASSTT